MLIKGAIMENKKNNRTPPQYNMGNTMKPYTIAVPKSGCLNTKMEGIAAVTKTINIIILVLMKKY